MIPVMPRAGDRRENVPVSDPASGRASRSRPLLSKIATNRQFDRI